MRNGHRAALLLSAAVIGMALAGRAGAQPAVVDAYRRQLTLHRVADLEGNPTQMAWGPDGRLYVRTTNSGVHSYAYDRATGQVSNHKIAMPHDGIGGIGIAFHGARMYLTEFDGSIRRLDDTNGNGVWGETAQGELNVAIVTGIPQGDHNTDQLQIRGDTLFVGIGRRTINGRRGEWTSGSLDDYGGKGFWSGGIGKTWGDSAYGGTIAWIQNLGLVADARDAANPYASTALTQSFIQEDDSPYRVTDAGKLIIHSAGTRNPFGLCLDRDGNLWFTNNFNRTQTLGNGEAGFGLHGDLLDSDFSRDVHDQVFKASEGADYGYADDNWRNKVAILTPGTTGYHRVLSTTFDNLFNTGPYTLHDPANPDGLGPSSSADGCGFFYAFGLPSELIGNLFITRWNTTITESPGGAGDTVRRSLTYSDVVAVDTETGRVRRVAYGFVNPIAVLWDGAQRLLIADYGSRTLYALRAGRSLGPLRPRSRQPIGPPRPH